MPPHNDSIKLLNEVIDNIRPNVEEVVAAKKVIEQRIVWKSSCRRNL